MRHQPMPHLVTVEEKAPEGREHREGQHHVEHGSATRDEVHAIESDEHACHRADEIRPREPACDARRHENRQRPQHGDRESPAEGRDPEEPLPARDDPLAERRVHDEGRVVLEDVDRAPIAVGGEDQLVGAVVELLLMPVAQEGEGILGVVDLVEGEGVRPAEVDEAQQSADDGGGEGARPASPAGRGERREEARCHRRSLRGPVGRRRALLDGSGRLCRRSM